MTSLSTKLKKVRASGDDAPPPSDAPLFKMSPRKVAMVAVDWSEDNEAKTDRAVYDQPGFYPLSSRIASACDGHGCDTILYALFSHSDYKHGPLKKQQIFGRQPEHLKWVVMETSMDRAKRDNVAQVWERDQKKPHTLVQRLARGSDGKGKRDLMNDLEGRMFGSTMLLLCGEIGIINTRRDSDEINDVHHFLDELDDRSIDVILNPGHTYMRRREMPIKRAELSKGKRWLLSVWHRGWHDSGPQGKAPWQVFYDGQEVTNRVVPIDHSLGPDVRIGTLELARTRRA
jgi:hypothetical protein